jgi:hypothetical protein
MVIRDPEGTNVVLSEGLSDEALDALRDLDWSERHGGYLVWDSDRHEWRDAVPGR